MGFMKNMPRKIIAMLIAITIMFMSTPITTRAVELGKVKSVKTKTDNRSYKGITSAHDMKYHNIKYKYGIKASWTKVKNASGYEIYVYGVGSKKWFKVKTTKKTTYTFTNMLKKDKFKFKVRAYQTADGKNAYGEWSKPKTVKVPTLMTYRKKGNHLNKKYYDRYAAEQAFDLQNKYRKQAGIEPLIWSDVLYDICQQRAKEITKDYSHADFIDTSERILTEKYGLKELDVEIGERNGFIDCMPLAAGENIAKNLNTYKDAMEGWKGSSGHYRNITQKDYSDGAIACYVIGGRSYWVAIFGGGNLDEIVKNNK